VEFTFRLLDEEKTQPPTKRTVLPSGPVKDGSGLEALYGILEEEFKDLGGGEAYLKAERAAWGPDPWEKIAMEEKLRSESGK
jgi:hypothetical protein